MASVTIRNLDDAIVKELKQQAKSHNRSLEAELREILSREIDHRKKMARLRRESRRIAAMTPDVPQTDSTLLIREDRDR